MNIDYAKIIETANRRKETLQALDLKLRDASHYYENVLDAKTYLDDLAKLWEKLDAEGRKLIGDPMALVYVSSASSNLAAACSKNYGDGAAGMRELVKLAGTN